MNSGWFWNIKSMIFEVLMHYFMRVGTYLVTLLFNKPRDRPRVTDGYKLQLNWISVLKFHVSSTDYAGVRWGVRIIILQTFFYTFNGKNLSFSFLKHCRIRCWVMGWQGVSPATRRRGLILHRWDWLPGLRYNSQTKVMKSFSVMDLGDLRALIYSTDLSFISFGKQGR